MSKQCEAQYRVWRCIREAGHSSIHKAFTSRDNDLAWDSEKIQELTPTGEVVSEIYFFDVEVER